MTALSKVTEFSGVSSVVSVICALNLKPYDLFKLLTCFSAYLRAVSPGVVCSIDHNILNEFLND